MKVQRTCPVCGRVYEADAHRLKWGRQTTCSRACSYELRATKLSTSKWFTCPVCGKKFSKCPAHVKAKHGNQFCSRECHYRGRVLGLTKRVVTEPYNHTEATLEQFSKNGVLRMRTGPFGTSIGKFEDEVSETLTTLGIAHVRQFPLYDAERNRWFACDFFLPTIRLVVEVNCSGNHADPRVIPRSTRCANRRAQIERDEARRSAVLAAGYRLAELWERDLAEDLEAAVRDAVTIA